MKILINKKKTFEIVFTHPKIIIYCFLEDIETYHHTRLQYSTVISIGAVISKNQKIFKRQLQQHGNLMQALNRPAPSFPKLVCTSLVVEAFFSKIPLCSLFTNMPAHKHASGDYTKTTMGPLDYI